MSEPITNLDDAVRECGALPVPLGSPADRSLDLLRTVVDASDAATAVMATVADASGLVAGLTAEVAELKADADRAKAPWGRGEDGRPLLPLGTHWTDVPELVDRTLAGIQSRVDGAQSGHWYDASVTETWRPAGTVRTNVDGYQRGVGQFIARPGDMELVLHAHDDLSWCLGMIAKFRARVAELEAERHTTNESLSDAAETLRANADRIAELETGVEAGCTCPPAPRTHQVGCPLVEFPVDGLTATFMPVASLRELDGLRERLPLDDPDRHALDLDADVRFARMACEHPDACACEPTGSAS